MQEKHYIVGIYCRLSKDDNQDGESISISTQKSLLTDYCNQQGYEIFDYYIDDGYSGLNFQRPGFQALIDAIDSESVNMVITKDLSRLGRDYILTGYYSEIFFPEKGIRYVALADGFDSLKSNNDIAPFKNILNDMYARDVSRKVKNAKHQRAKQGRFIGSQPPYGYVVDNNGKSRLIIDNEAAAVVKMIYNMAEKGCGSVAIAENLEKQKILAPSVYKLQKGITHYISSNRKNPENCYRWNAATVSAILTNPVYTGLLTSLKTEVVNCKTKQRIRVPEDDRITVQQAHPAIISQLQFSQVQQMRSSHICYANTRRDNMFRGILFCQCCGHPLTISQKQLISGKEDIYFCMHHYLNRDECPQTHRVYHKMLSKYVIEEIRKLSHSMKRSRVNLSIANYSDITELTTEIIQNTIKRIEIGHVRKKSKPSAVIRIYWKFE